jgi:oxygen-independent coproporphyrinogen-3 oxidase
MLSLRTCEGLDLSSLTAQDTAYLLPLAKKYIDEGLLVLSGNHLHLSRQGLFVSDMVMADLMRV